MGAKGIRRRKPYRKLPPARVPTENEVIPPHIMWPDSDSGFEADPWSPAGRAQREWWLLQGLTRRGSRPAVSIVLWAVIAVLALAVLSNLLALVL